MFFFLLPHIYFLTFADGDGVSRELSQHPVHLTPDDQGNRPPSALVPFCSYQENSNLFEQENPNLKNLTVCDRFEPTILEGQLCFSLDIAKLKQKPTKSGKSNGLFLLIDPNPYPLISIDKSVGSFGMKRQSFKFFIHTLAPYTTFTPGSYGMSTLKRMTSTKSFEKLPDHQKKCQVHNREECQTKKYLDQVQRECKCSPWSLSTSQGKDQVEIKSISREYLKICRCLPSVAQRRRAVLETKP